ncbi:MAG: hypothetical protein PVJ86_04645, partial [Phycisphaerales bacterium]
MRRYVCLKSAMAALAAFLFLYCVPESAGAEDVAGSAREMLEASGVKGGLVVHLGCGGGSLTAALRANDSYLVNGLDTNPEKVA